MTRVIAIDRSNMNGSNYQYVREAFEPWMIGKTVEVIQLRKNDRQNDVPNTGTVYYRHAGVLASYSASDSRTGVTLVVFEGGSERSWGPDYDYVIEVLKP